jgi:ABC transport system ATP-binding/permease protein
MTYLSVEKLSKNYGLKILFEGLTFGLQKGDKTALIAPNGTGKSTLMRILAGKEKQDSGIVSVRNGIHISFLEQEPELDPALSISGYIAAGHSPAARLSLAYEQAAAAQAAEYTSETAAAFERATAAMEAANAWDFEQRLTQILGKLNVHDLDQPIATLSGGERKRVALAFALLDDPDLLILDEPTNHLDVEMIGWLEQYLARSTMTLLMVTHDRYFLDRVCTHILELSDGTLYHHRGNYSYYLEKRAEREEVFATETAKAGQLLKKELEWMRRQPKARTTKSKSRIAAYYDTEKKAAGKADAGEVRLEVNMSRLGKKILELKKVSKRFDEKIILDGFSYSFNRGERIGVIGPNGVGKSSFLNILTGALAPDFGEIDTGQTIVFGHYRQQNTPPPEDVRVIDVIREVAEVIQMTDGSHISVSQFLEHFNFPGSMQYAPVAKLSGGERRRLALMMVLVKNPNFLILDEPTNDLDLVTLNKLEEFLLGFGGCLILVSHDRFFMDRLVQHYFAFEGEGRIRDFNGRYEEYRELLEEEELAARQEAARIPEGSKSSAKNGFLTDGESKAGVASNSGKKEVTNKSLTPLSFKERKEFDRIEKEIEKLEAEKTQLEVLLSSGKLSHEELRVESERYAGLSSRIEGLTLHWMELAERA